MSLEKIHTDKLNFQVWPFHLCMTHFLPCFLGLDAMFEHTWVDENKDEGLHVKNEGEMQTHVSLMTSVEGHFLKPILNLFV